MFQLGQAQRVFARGVSVLRGIELTEQRYLQVTGEEDFATLLASGDGKSAEPDLIYLLSSISSLSSLRQILLTPSLQICTA